MIPKQAFVLAGGKGERLRPLTKNTPKPMVLVGEKPILQYGIEALVKFGVKKIVLGVSYKAEKIEKYFGNGTNFGTKIVYVKEKGFLGTGGALKNAKNEIYGRFIMLNGDTLMNIDFEKMNKFHEKKKALGTIAIARVKNVSEYGIIKPKYSDSTMVSGIVADFVEKPTPENAPSDLSNAGAYILEKETIELLPDGFCFIEKTLFPELASKGKLFFYKHFGQWFPTDDMQKLEKAKKEWKQR